MNGKRYILIALILIFFTIVNGIIQTSNAQTEQYYILHTNDIFEGRVVTVKQPAYNQYGDELVLVEFTDCHSKEDYPTCGHLGVRFSELERVQ